MTKTLQFRKLELKAGRLDECQQLQHVLDEIDNMETGAGLCLDGARKHIQATIRRLILAKG